MLANERERDREREKKASSLKDEKNLTSIPGREL